MISELEPSGPGIVCLREEIETYISADLELATHRKAANPFHSLAALQKLAHYDSFGTALAVALPLR
jgi:hypothetical protein